MNKSKIGLLGREKIVTKYLDLKKTDKVLSIGCKRASFELKILNQIKSLTAFDIQQKIINENNKKFGKFKNVKFEYGDITKKVNYPNNSFDKVIFMEVIEHLPKAKQLSALTEIYRILKKNGILVLSTPNKYWYADLTDFAHLLGVHRHYSIVEIKKMCQEVGFKIEASKIVGSFGSATWIGLRMLLRIFQLHSLVKFIEDKYINNIKEKEYAQSGFLNIFIKCRK